MRIHMIDQMYILENIFMKRFLCVELLRIIWLSQSSSIPQVKTLIVNGAWASKTMQVCTLKRDFFLHFHLTWQTSKATTSLKPCNYIPTLVIINFLFNHLSIQLKINYSSSSMSQTIRFLSFLCWVHWYKAWFILGGIRCKQ